MAIGPRQHPDFRTPEESQKARETAIDFLTRRQADPRIDGIRWKSVLDENTTVECRMLDGLEWDYPGFEPRGHKVAFPKSQNCNFHVRFHGLRTKRDPQFGLGWPSAQNDETLSIRNATPPIFTRLASQESGVSSNGCAKGVKPRNFRILKLNRASYAHATIIPICSPETPVPCETKTEWINALNIYRSGSFFLFCYF